MIPEQAVDAALSAMQNLPAVEYRTRRQTVLALLEAAAPHMLADILEDAANTAETDELTTAAEVIYDLRRHAKDLRPMLSTEGDR